MERLARRAREPFRKRKLGFQPQAFEVILTLNIPPPKTLHRVASPWVNEHMTLTTEVEPRIPLTKLLRGSAGEPLEDSQTQQTPRESRKIVDMNLSVYTQAFLALLAPIHRADQVFAGESFVHPSSSFCIVAAKNYTPLTNIVAATEMPSQFCCTPYCRECYESLPCNLSSRLACMNAGPVSLFLLQECSDTMSHALKNPADTVTVQYLLRDCLSVKEPPKRNHSLEFRL